MFIYSAKMDKKKLAAILACVGVGAIVLILFFTGGCGKNRDSETGSLLTEVTEEVEPVSVKSVSKLLKKARISDSADAARLLTSLGWTVDPEPVETREVVIPAEFSDVYKKYNELQQSQGFDLAKHAGSTATRWTMRVRNHPSGEEEVYATLLVIGSRVVGGDVCAARLDGFMHGLSPESYSGSVYGEVTEDLQGEQPSNGSAGISDSGAAESK
ncbi:MAG: DUF4830 domain-containing protein [Clostridia bacterium]|nr:DUF4830 domain-containing protein [Clostridia bacterium]